MQYAIGIDLGTKKSLVGVMKNNRPFIIPNKYGSLSIPSLVLVAPDERIFAGLSAQKHSERYDSKNITIGSIKRLIGRQGKTGWGWWETYPQEVSAFILSELKEQAEEYLGGSVYFAVIAIPSHFDECQRRATIEAAEIAGLKNVFLLNETVAAALAYGFNKKGKDEKILVFDFGAGTLDVSVLEIGREGTYDVLCVEGDSNLGGDDFDTIIVDYIIRKIHREFGENIKLTSSQNLLLKDIAESAKIELSTLLTTKIYIPGFLQIDNVFHNLDIQIDRSTFEKIARPLFEQAIAVVDKAIKASSLKVSDLNAFLLLGGCRHIPFLAKAIKKKYKISPIAGVDSETCVVEGACIDAGVKTGEVKDTLLLNIIPSSYGIQVEKSFFKIIEKNTTIPVKKTHLFTTTYNNQSTLEMRIYQGESDNVENNLVVGILELTNIPPAPSGVPEIEVSFDIDALMVVRVSARVLKTDNFQEVVLRSPYGLNDSQLRIMGQKLSLWRSDRKIRENI